MLFVSAAAGVAIIGGAAAWRAADVGRGELRVGSQTSTGVGSSIVAVHERIEYVQEAELTCPGEAVRSGGFSRMSIETWATAGKVRTTVTYPDGTARDVIQMDDEPRPPKVFTRGVVRGETVGCVVEGNGILVAEPGQSDVFSLNPAARSARTTSGVKRIPGYADLGVQVPGEHADSLGRAWQLWRQRISGFVDINGRRHPVTQTTEWYVDGPTDRVMEKTYTNEIGSLGTARWRGTLVESRRSRVPASTYETGGYERELAEPATPPTTSQPVSRGTSDTTLGTRP